MQANGGGPTVVRDANGSIAQESLLGDDVARGGDLFRLNCASCHNFTGKGGALSSGKYAPDLGDAEPAQIYTAMLTGPQNMPKFSDRQLSPDEKRDIVAYVREAAETPNPGGYGLGGFGPAPEGMAIWIIGMVAIIGAALWIGSTHDHERRRQGNGHPRPDRRSRQPTDAELASMSRDELVELGGKLDGVEIVYKDERWPVEGTKAEKRAERSVAYWLLLGGFSGLALLLVFLFWPWEYQPYGSASWFLYSLATPLYGLTFGLSILAIGIGAVLFQKKFIPEEIIDPGPPRRALPRDPAQDHRGQPHRCAGDVDAQAAQADRLSLGIGLGAFGLGTLVAFIGGLIKNPWKPVVPTADGKKAVLWTSGWTPRFKGETIYMARATGNASHGSPFVKMRPEDIDAGGMETVFPWRESDGDGTTVESHHRLNEIAWASATR